MDAMNRGAVVLSTPVGQMLELIENGVNGYVCRTADEFVTTIADLSADPARLQQMRVNALRTAPTKRSDDVLKQAVTAALSALGVSGYTAGNT